jgi:SpoVK/Ycf46/Vps4 family AAA+-type ATPase
MAFDRSGRGENEDLKQVGTLLQEIDKIKGSNVIVIGATNKINLLDPAIRRRFDMKTLVDIPDFESIQALVKKNLSAYSKGATLLESDKDIEEIAKQLKGFSNSSICAISKQAALNAMKRDRADIALEDYEKAIKETTEEKPDRTQYLSEAAGSKKIGF